jgi:hypothetical protein
MRHVTVALQVGLHKMDDGHKAYCYRLIPGTAWKIDDQTREANVMEVDSKITGRAEYTYELRWIDGRTVAIFKVDGTMYCQPIKYDKRAKEPKPKLNVLNPPDQAVEKAKMKKLREQDLKADESWERQKAREDVAPPRRKRERHLDPL